MDETHELLLALAGRVDDDLLAWARELLAVGEDTRAVELVTAGLSADRVALPAAVRDAVVEAAANARIDLDADAALPAAVEGDPEHRFTADHEDERLTAAVRALPARLLDGARLQVAWRLTPAGAAPGPLPHPVLLVEVDAGGRPADVLAYQLYVALDRAGALASVEVLTSGRPVSAYHTAARREARPVDVDDELAEPVPLRAEPADEPAHVEEHTERVPDSPPVPRPQPLRTASEGGRRRRAAPEPAPRAAEPRMPTVTPITRNAAPSPGPLLRRDGGPARPAMPTEPPGEATEQQPAVRPTAEVQGPPPAEAPTYRAMQDPLSGPLNAPLMAPLLDPTPDDEYDDGYEGAAVGAHGISPLAPDAGVPVEEGWSDDWASGDWAVAATDLGGEEAPPAPEPMRSSAPRHRFTGPTPPLPAPPAATPAPQAELGLRPDSLARLSDADRELLARLQAELGAAGRKPRVTRRAGVAQNGNGRPPHGPG